MHKIGLFYKIPFTSPDKILIVVVVVAVAVVSVVVVVVVFVVIIIIIINKIKENFLFFNKL